MGKINFKSYCDLVDKLNYIKYSAYKKLPLKHRNLVLCCLISVARLLKSVIFGDFKYHKVADVLLIAPTLNNQRTVIPIANYLRSSYQLISNFRVIYPMACVHVYSFIYFFYFLRYYFLKNSTDKELIRGVYHDFFCAIGYYIVTEKFFKKNPQLKCILFANDHIVQNRCLIELSSSFGIKTIYTQHASVSESFPALSFSYSFLDGMESWEKYENIGHVSGDIFLSGSPRFDSVVSIDKHKSKNLVGVAINILDSLDKVCALCAFLQKECHKRVILRPHPGMQMFDFSNFIDMNISISYPSKESSFDFLANLELLISNESSIHLDALLVKVPSIVYNFSNNDVRDSYSYIKNGMVKLCTSTEELRQLLLDGVKVNIEMVRYYVASFSTPYEGRVGEHIASFIDALLIGEEMKFINENYIFNSGYYQYK